MIHEKLNKKSTTTILKICNGQLSIIKTKISAKNSLPGLGNLEKIVRTSQDLSSTSTVLACISVTKMNKIFSIK